MTWSRILILVEGVTESEFVTNLLEPHFVDRTCAISATLCGSANHPNRRHGVKEWESVRRQAVRLLKGDPRLIVTTFVDFFRLPRSWWNGVVPVSSNSTTIEKAIQIENVIGDDISNTLGTTIENSRFVPFVMMHEFEAFMFINPVITADILRRPDVMSSLESIRSDFIDPEFINDGVNSSPSKRLLSLVDTYRKVVDGTAITSSLGLPAIRAACPHFNEWIMRLETAVRG